MNSPIRCGFNYATALRSKKTGLILESWPPELNRVPLEGLNDIANAYFKGGSGPSNLYIGLWSGSHIPDGTETAANLLSMVTEVTNYSQAGRLPLVLGSVADGGCSNAASLARFDTLSAATVNGAFLSTVQAKGATTGKLLSVVRFANPRAVDAAVYLEVVTGFQFISL